MKTRDRTNIVHRLFGTLFILFGPSLLPCQAMEIGYTVSMPNPTDHYVHVEIDIRDATQEFLDLRMPAWSPGRYLILNFARNLCDFSAQSPEGSLPFRKTDKQTWRIHTQGASTITVQYRVYGNNLSGELSLLNDTQAFLDGASLYLYVEGHKENPVFLEIVPPSGWMILSSAGELGQTHFTFPHYDRLIDELVQLGAFFVERFTTETTEFRLCMLTQGNRSPNKSLIEKVRKITETAVQMLGSLDSPRYTFFYHFLPDSRDSAGMEHLNCCQLTRKHAMDDAGSLMETTVWVTAHELIHAWNGKRLRPQNLGPFDYSQEVYTDSLWFVEGITSYLADLVLVRSGVWTKDDFYKQIASQITAFRASPGIRQRSPEEASFDTWLWPIDGSRESDWNNTWTSYYISGELLGACMDLQIRRLTKNRRNFDDFFRLLYDDFYRNADTETGYAPGRGYRTEDILQALEETTHSVWRTFYSEYVASPGDIPFSSFLEYAALDLREKKDTPPVPYTGLHLISAPGGYAQIQWLDWQSPAAKAGLQNQDVFIALDGERVLIRDFNDILRRHSIDNEIEISFLRENRFMKITLPLDRNEKTVQYELAESLHSTPLARKIRNAWISTIPRKNSHK